MPRLLVVAPHASYRIAPYVETARALGAEVIVASETPAALVQQGVEGVRIAFADCDRAAQALVRLAEQRRVSAVLGTDDSTTELAARVARALGLPHNDPAAVQLARRKDLARIQLSKANVPAPAYRIIHLCESLATQLDDVHFPCVVKPVALSASRGVIRADDVRSLMAACARTQAIVQQAGIQGEAAQRLLLEEFVPGREVALEGLLIEGRLQLLAIFDKPDALDGPFFEETYYVTPSRFPAAVQMDLQQTVEAACHAYGLVTGPVHAECRINDQGVWVLEVASRTIGGLCGRLFQFATGQSLEQVVLAQMLGLPSMFTPPAGGAGVLMIPIPEAGILRRIEGLSAARRIPYIEDIVIDVAEGYELVPLPEGSSYLGFIYAVAPSAEAAEQALREAHACLTVVVAPLWKPVVSR